MDQVQSSKFKVSPHRLSQRGHKCDVWCTAWSGVRVHPSLIILDSRGWFYLGDYRWSIIVTPVCHTCLRFPGVSRKGHTISASLSIARTAACVAFSLQLHKLQLLVHPQHACLAILTLVASMQKLCFRLWSWAELDLLGYPTLFNSGK